MPAHMRARSTEPTEPVGSVGSAGPGPRDPAEPAASTSPVAPAAPRAVRVAFVAVVAVACLLPLVGMLWAPTTTTTENRELAEVPELWVEGSLNEDYLSDWGTYFEDHFAYRSELVSLNAELRAALLGDSAATNVVVGEDGWLYYEGTLPDYTGTNLLTSRGIQNIVFNLSLMEGYVEANGATFVVAFAPNKNSLYDDAMPYWYTAGATRNLTVLEAAMAEEGLSCVSLFDLLSAEDGVLYYLRDSHWNTLGAYLAAQALLEAAGATEALALVEGLDYELVDDYVGDLNSMLYPTTATPEEDYDFSAQLDWDYVEGEDVEDSWVVTSGAGTGTLLVYRDSFANNLLGFLATGFETAYFTKYVPYDLTQVAQYGADVVIVERAERNLADLGTDPAIMPAPGVSLGEVEEASELASGSLAVEADGDYYVVTGDLPEAWCDEDVSMYVGVEAADGTISWYVPWHVTTDDGDYGYKAYFRASTLEGAVALWVACTDGDSVVCVETLVL